MCGIVGYVGPREVVPLLLDGLKRLEYRGYDSAGVAVVNGGGLQTARAEGKLDELVKKVGASPLHGTFGLGHTRWATHGRPSERNAHPIVDSHGRVAVIHNGIIENFAELKNELKGEGWTFSTDTDTEVIANLVSRELDRGASLLDAVEAARQRLTGHYAFAVLRGDGGAANGHREIVAARQGPPLVLGVGQGEQFLASDPTALVSYTRQVVYLENGDLACIAQSGVDVRDRSGKPVQRPVRQLSWDPGQAEKGGYKHYMIKEIHEQPRVVQETFSGRVDFEKGRVELEELGIAPERLAKIERVHVLACGTSWHAALVGKFLIEELARLPVEVDYGSEYRYRDPIVDGSVLALGVSQSGETADTLSAMEAARERGALLACICNVPGSQATRISEGTLLTHAGPEIGVASTKAFTTQLVAFYLLALYLRQSQSGGQGVEPRHLQKLSHVPQAIEEALEGERRIEELARRWVRANDFLYLGRGINYPIALEGALKLKEISYIHAEGYPAGEMKHGPIALIDEDLPVVAVATGERVFDKMLSNLQEVKARDGKTIVVTDRPGDVGDIADEVLAVPSVGELLQPIVNVVPLQLLAYHIGVRRGADVDQPRNLAKSVTVE
ncbi:MAG TPA: glutamine--fructose-6-phosphate transaminase (isomerizing) [Thermoanaerobaculia bacterium]|jgi:glucosamine--fructose-6-phosphate aminotransferase (isomerizing)|nr:glutamine--fructose-6-phosphate transaminase (isomerizing) [Thermoanaerobaculia bacterium]